MQIELILDVPDNYVDEDDHTGLTEEGYEVLMQAVTAVGFDVSDGPSAR